MKWNTSFTRTFGCKLPIMGAPMAGVSGAELAAETCKAGGLGFIAAGHFNSNESFHKLEEQIRQFRKLSSAGADAPNTADNDNYPLAIGFISHSTFAEELGWELFENVLKDHRPQVVQFFAPWWTAADGASGQDKRKNNVDLARSYGCKIIAQVGTVEDANKAMDVGVDCIVAQGVESGGHGLRLDHGCGTLSLVSNVVACAADREKRPCILAAGGIMDGKGLAAALALGADGAVLGTRLWASVEAQGPLSLKEALVAAKNADDVVRTRAFDVIANSFRKVQWPPPYDTSGVLRNKVTDEWDAKIPELDAALRKRKEPDGTSSIVDEFLRAEAESYVQGAPVYSGKGVGKVVSIDPAFDIVTRTAEEAQTEILGLQDFCFEEE